MWNTTFFEWPNMDMTRWQYERYCREKRAIARKWTSDMCKPIREIRNCSAEDILKKCGQVDTVPVNISGLLGALGISALPRDFSEIELRPDMQEKIVKRGHILGALVSSGDNAAIFYRKNDSIDSHRYRFTIAHELGHCCLTGETSHIEYRFDGNTSDENEIAANIFAGELLIPEKNLNSVIDELILPTVYTLAEIFCVSENVMRARLRHLNCKSKVVGFNL